MNGLTTQTLRGRERPALSGVEGVGVGSINNYETNPIIHIFSETSE
jgi:hypothetical protein